MARRWLFWKLLVLGLGTLLVAIPISSSLQIPFPVKPPKSSLKALKSAGLAKIDLNTITASGLSSGAYMAVMFHYIFSSKINGAGLFGAGPFGLHYNLTGREDIFMYALNLIRNLTPLIGRSAEFLEKQTIELANKGLIDPVTNLNGSKVFIFEGGLDFQNPPWMQKLSVDMYKYFGADLEILFIPNSTHGIPTDNYGLPCGIFNPFHNGVNNCDVESIFQMFSHFLGPSYISPPSSTFPATGKFFEFDQNPHAPSGNAVRDFLNPIGAIYIPVGCQVAKATYLFAIKTGYFQVADANRIIVLFPRPAPEFYALQYDDRTNAGCWDWFGTTTLKPELKEAPQVKSVANMLNTLIGSTLF